MTIFDVRTLSWLLLSAGARITSRQLLVLGALWALRAVPLRHPAHMAACYALLTLAARHAFRKDMDAKAAARGNV